MPSMFNIILMTAGGNYISAAHGKGFSFSLINKQITLQPDTYCFMVDPIWNTFSDKDPTYKQVIVDIYGPESFTISPLNQSDGMKLLATAVKQVAIHKSPE